MSGASLIAELELHLSTTNNRRGRPFQRKTINAYVNSAKSLDRWLSEHASEHVTALPGTSAHTAGVAELSFLGVDVHVLNRHLRWWYETYDVPKSQDGKGGYTGGTNTQSRNLRAMFNYLAEEYDHPNPFKDPRLHNWAAPELGKPRTLSREFISDCLKITAWGPSRRDFETVRDHALLRVLTEGLRAEEILSLRTFDLDLQSATLVVVPLKGNRNSTDGRPIPLQPSTIKALQRYLRVRALHKRAADDWLWLGTRNRSRLLYAGLHRMTKRRAEQAGYDAEHVAPHSFCHSWCDDLLSSGVSGENVMAIRGWRSASMLRRYAQDTASQRAINAVHNLGDRY
ncbi:tyrosine-type recombinase/integrase [Streptomyces sp. HNM0663]|uniref:Tyrosine-type recombinase/integrase n=1 Tax=Streptomyces chengmaiensis TaxID=3040919 RepID=A0ABT6HZE9_9ACTN|nr:site-specific integrase [Streptomyces chengmaiensis]MDH2394093.1 tyrosine-type recombinase/integrase [Streptomyces chengmaiensis]